ncbi:MAG: hypothetical protein ABIO24_08705 [Saprospiraceae bacterium]
MVKCTASVFLFLVVSQSLFAQINLPQTATITTGQVSAQISTSGALIDNFLVPSAAGDSSVSLLREVSLWMGGEVAGNILLAVQRKDSVSDEFVSGYRGLDQSKGIWKVTQQQVQDHLNDFQDNGHIDNPIPAIYAWPGMHNPHSLNYNGFAVDTFDRYITAPFQDVNADNIYDPDDGDFPFGTGVGVFHQASEMLFAPFHVNMKGAPMEKFPLDGSTLLFAYDCDDANFLEAAIFCRVSYIYNYPYPLDTFYLGCYIDGNIGGSQDDYMGSIHEGSKVYFYNGDNFDEGGFGPASPLLAFDPYLLQVGGQEGSVSANSVMTIHPGIETPLMGTDEPTQDIEYYRYMDGKWRDGTSLTYGGTGKGGSQPTSFIYPGNPANSDEWSEVSAQNPPGDRRAMLSYKQNSLLPKARNRLLFSLIYVPPNPIAEQIKTMNDYSLAHFEFNFVDYFPPEASPLDSITCFPISKTTDLVSHPARLFPNPAHGELNIQTETMELATLSFFNVLGTLERFDAHPDQSNGTVKMNVSGLPPGLHLFQCVWKDGYRKTWKVLIE